MKIRSINKTQDAYRNFVYLVWTNERLNSKCHYLFHSFKTLEQVGDYLAQNKIYNRRKALEMYEELAKIERLQQNCANSMCYV